MPGKAGGKKKPLKSAKPSEKPTTPKDMGQLKTLVVEDKKKQVERICFFSPPKQAEHHDAAINLANRITELEDVIAKLSHEIKELSAYSILNSKKEKISDKQIPEIPLNIYCIEHS